MEIINGEKTKGKRRKRGYSPALPVLLPIMNPLLLLRHNDEIISTVFLPAIFRMIRTNRFFLSVADERYSFCRNSHIGKILLRTRCAALAKGLIVLLSTSFVAVPLDTDLYFGVCFKPL